MTALAPINCQVDDTRPGPVDIVLDWDGRTVAEWEIEEWSPELARGTFDVGAVTYCAVAYSVPRLQPDGRVVARIYVQPEFPPEPQVHHRRPRHRRPPRRLVPVADA